VDGADADARVDVLQVDRVFETGICERAAHRSSRGLYQPTG
jgi:hypothetical protein